MSADASQPGQPGRQSALTRQIETGLAGLAGQELSGHPAAFEAMDAQIRAALRDLDGA